MTSCVLSFSYHIHDKPDCGKPTDGSPALCLSVRGWGELDGGRGRLVRYVVSTFTLHYLVPSREISRPTGEPDNV